MQFTQPLHVNGPYSIPLQGNVWVGMQWDLVVTSARFVFADMPFTALSDARGEGGWWARYRGRSGPDEAMATWRVQAPGVFWIGPAGRRPFAVAPP